MSANVIQLHAEQTTYSIKDIDSLIAAIENRVPPREIMRIEHITEFLGVSRKTIDNMCRAGMPFHRLPGLGGKLFVRSEIINYTLKH